MAPDRTTASSTAPCRSVPQHFYILKLHLRKPGDNSAAGKVSLIRERAKITVSERFTIRAKNALRADFFSTNVKAIYLFTVIINLAKIKLSIASIGIGKIISFIFYNLYFF